MGRPKWLGAKKIRWVYDTVTTKNPLEFKLPFALWTRAQIRTVIAQRFDVKRSLVSVGRLLAQLGLTCQCPLFRAYQQDRSLVARREKEEYPKIPAEAERESAESFFEDESGVRSDFHSGMTWAPQGTTPVVRVTDRRFSLYTISVVGARGELRFMVVQGGVGATVFIDFLKRLMCGQSRPIYLTVDGHHSHRAKKVKAYVESLQGKLRLFFLPPYSPELHPDELSWNDVKNNGIGRVLVYGPADVMRAVAGCLRDRQKTPASRLFVFLTSRDSIRGIRIVSDACIG